MNIKDIRKVVNLETKRELKLIRNFKKMLGAKAQSRQQQDSRNLPEYKANIERGDK